jgi:hypothetical protein
MGLNDPCSHVNLTPFCPGHLWRLGHLSWAYLACQEISPQHPPPAGTTLLSVPLSSAPSLTRTFLLNHFPPSSFVLSAFSFRTFLLRLFSPSSFVLSAFSFRTFLLGLFPPSSLVLSFALCQDIPLQLFFPAVPSSACLGSTIPQLSLLARTFLLSYTRLGLSL